MWHASAAEIELVRETLPGADVVAPSGQWQSRFECTLADVESFLPDADVIIAWAIPKGSLEKATQLKILSWMHSGVDDLEEIGVLDLAKRRGFRIANIRGANAVAVAEQGMMFMLALAKRVLVKHRFVQEGRQQFPLWDNDRSGMLKGCTVGIVGMGHIGSHVAKRAKAFDMRVLGIRRNKNISIENVDTMYGPSELTSVLPVCDYVVLAAPQTDETHHLIAEAEIASMKNSAFLINIARGDLIKEKPLYDALVGGELAGFATDVWWRYEYGRTFPNGWGPRSNLQQLPNVICSLHEAHNADGVLEKNLRWGIENVAEYFRGEPISREINLELGY